MRLSTRMPTIASSSRWPVPQKSAVIPPQQNRTAPRQFDQALYQTRHLIENFFCKLKQFRAIAIATRYDKTARNFLAALHLAAATIWLI